MTAIITTLIPIAFSILEYFLTRNKENKEMAQLFYKFVEKIQNEYLMSANMRDDAKDRMKKITEKPFIEAP